VQELALSVAGAGTLEFDSDFERALPCSLNVSNMEVSRDIPEARRRMNQNAVDMLA
jgi:hypothetical protein